MPRIRTIKPEFWSSPGVARMTPLARLTFIGMWNWADDAGRGTYNPRELMGFIFPHDEEMTVAEFRALCAEIRAHVAVDFFEVAGRHYFEISSWKKHQSKHAKFDSSKYPDPDEGHYIDPVNMQVIGEVAEIRRNSATSSRNSGTSARKKNLGTGEQGNRGTGEGVKETSNPTGGHDPNTENPQPKNLDELAAAHAARTRCPKHQHIPAGEWVEEDCRECQKLRQGAEAEAEAEREAVLKARQECDLCDPNGMRYEDGQAWRCDHKPETGPNHGPVAPQSDQHDSRGQSPQNDKPTRQKPKEPPF